MPLHVKEKKQKLMKKKTACPADMSGERDDIIKNASPSPLRTKSGDRALQSLSYVPDWEGRYNNGWCGKGAT